MNKIRKVEKQNIRKKKQNKKLAKNIKNEKENENENAPEETREPKMKTYNFLTQRQVAERYYIYDLCLIGVGESEMLINDAAEEYARFVNKKAFEKFEWIDYLVCDGQPNIQIPKDIRSYILSLQIDEEHYFKNLIHWSFNINEQSILTQNLQNNNYTRVHLIKSRPNFGEFFNQQIIKYLKVIKRIENFLLNGKFVLETPPSIINELVEVKGVAENEICNIFDRLTYRIVSAHSIYMDEISLRTSEFYYKGDDFALQIWSLNNIPIIFENLEPPSFRANFHQLNVIVHIPYNVLEDNLTLRAIHYNVDFLSMKAKGSSNKITPSLMKASVSLFDAFESILYEWRLKMELETEVTNKLKNLRNDWENRQAAIVEMEKAKLKKELRKPSRESFKLEQKRKKEEEEKKIRKTEKAPQEIPENGTPDISHDFLEREQQIVDEFLNSYFNPDVLELKENEINLRHFTILGGIYFFNFIEKPEFIDLKISTLDFTIHRNGNCLKMKNVKVVTEDDYVPKSHAKRFYMDEDYYEDEENPLFVLTFDLPKDLCHWDVPIVCHYEYDVVGYTNVPPEILKPPKQDNLPMVFSNIRASVANISKRVTPSLKLKADAKLSYSDDILIKPSKSKQSNPNSSLRYSEAYSLSPSHARSGRTSALSKSISVYSGISSVDYSEYDDFVEDMYGSRATRLYSLLPNAYSAFSSINEMHQGITNIQSRRHNFDLNNPITYNQISDLKKYCLPKIISSHTFPVEFYENEMKIYEENKKQAKNKLGSSKKKNKTVIDAPKSLDERYHSLDEQNNPERLFPIFDDQATLHKMAFSTASEEATEHKPMKFYELVDNLDNVKRDYLLRVKPIIESKNMRWNVLRKFLVGVKVFKKNLEHQLEEQRLAEQKLHQQHKKRNKLHQTPSSERKNRGSQLTLARGSQLTQARGSQFSLTRASSLTSLLSISDYNLPEVKYVLNYDDRSVTPRSSDSSGKTDDKESLNDNKDVTTLTEVVAVEEFEDKNLKKYTYSHWTTSYIKESIFDKETHTMKVYTDRLGTMGFAFDTYIHLPFTSWDIQPCPDDPLEVIVTIETRFVKCVFFVSTEGYRGYVINLNEVPSITRSPHYYIYIEKPISDLNVLKKLFREKNINIFPELDALYYINREYFCVKHFALELLVYDCISLNCNFMKFRYSTWNRLTKRREIILAVATYVKESPGATKRSDIKNKDPTADMHLVLLTPEGATFIEAEELCSDRLEEIHLKLTKTWRNLEFYADLNHLIVSIAPEANEVRLKNAFLICMVKNLLSEIKPLSYS